MRDTTMAKAKKVKLPKHIGGVKIPKELRKKGGALLEKANSAAGREVIAGALTMAAAAATSAVQRQRASRFASAPPEAPVPPVPPVPPIPPVPPVPPVPPERPGEPGIADPQALADAIGNAAEAVLIKLFGTKRTG